MKKKLLILATLLVITVGFSSCTKEDPQPNQPQFEELEAGEEWTWIANKAL